MRKAKFQRVVSFLLALTLMLGAGIISVSAAEGEEAAFNTVTEKTIADYKEELESISYSEYQKTFGQYDTPDKAVVFDAIEDLDEENTTLDWLTAEQYALLTDGNTVNDASLQGIFKAEIEGTPCLYTPGDGKVSFKKSGVTPGLYSVRVYYYPIVGKSAAIEREFYINGGAAFSESRSITFAKRWTNDYDQAEYKLAKGESADSYLSKASELGLTATKEDREDGTYILYEFPDLWTEEISTYLNDTLGARFMTTDLEKNELRPTAVQSPEWCTYELCDSQGFYAEAFRYIIEPDEDGNVMLTLKGVNEAMAIAKIELYPVEDTITYAEYIAKYANAPKGESVIKLEAEYTDTTATNTVYPAEDRASAATSPVDTSRTLLNTIGGEKWGTPGQTVTYKFKVDSTGLYSFDFRYKQSVLDGLFVSRAIKLYSEGLAEGADGYYDGYPFLEASAARFNYSSYWQSSGVVDGSLDENGEQINHEFYLVEGVEYTLQLEVTLGSMASVINEIEDILNCINTDYLSILRLTGTSPDDYRDYNFTRVMPQTLADMVRQSDRLYAVAEELKAVAGENSSTVASLEKVAETLFEMHDEDKIAPNLEQLKTHIGSLGTFLSDAKKQPLLLDYILVQSDDNDLPVAEPGFFKKVGHEISSFIQSFLRDYNAMGAMSEIEGEALEVWVAYGRDQSQVIRNLVTNDFTYDSGIPVDLKLITGGTLLPSILAGMGPDVYLGLDSGSVINYAIRGALLTVDVKSDGTVREDFDEVTENFTDAAMLVLGIANADDEYHYYGLPEIQGFPMMFVRIDVLAEMNIDIPTTWEDIYMAQTVLEGNNMEIGLTTDYQVFLYQGGSELFADDGMRINLDSKEGLDAFETMCTLFTMRGFPYSYSAANRFRTGEMPILVADYTGMYNQLKVFATEIEGLWKMVPLPGTMDKTTGQINNCAIAGVTADVIVHGCDREDEAWEFLKWFTGADAQTAYANDMVAIIGDSAKHNTANRQALESMPWTTEELVEIRKQFNNLASVPNYPGAYYIGRYTNFAFLAAYNDDADPVASLLSYINSINKEINRKRAEFKLETLEIGQTLADKRITQAITALEILGEDDAYFTDLSITVSAAFSDEEIVLLQDYSDQLMEKLSSVDESTYFVKVSRQDQAKKSDGGYDIDELSYEQMIYFAAQCIADAANALSTY
ncbi:MAG: extracellular solute-binding protein [Clostridia bacterium]|nr:extracellular solute-binding protein [Clostridia bacterium]